MTALVLLVVCPLVMCSGLLLALGLCKAAARPMPKPTGGRP